jgi:NADPH:quinone reductase-like Zn-dependent oxidoreductase
VLQVVDIEEPHAGAGQVRIAVKAAGVNPIDYKLRSGAMAQMMPLTLPAGVGLDAAGVVDEVGAGVQGISAGDEVFGSSVGGATAEYAVLKEWATKPAAMSFEEAAGLPVPTETARRALKQLGVQAGDTLLVNGGAGGVGLATVQFAVAMGATVIATASEANHDYLRSLGAQPTTYGDGLADRVRAIAPGGVDLAFDAVGFGALPALVDLTGTPDKVLTIADYAGAQQLGVRVSGGGGEFQSPEARQEAADLFEAGKFTMPVAETFSLDETAKAHEKSEAGHVRGKYIIRLP